MWQHNSDCRRISVKVKHPFPSLYIPPIQGGHKVLFQMAYKISETGLYLGDQGPWAHQNTGRHATLSKILIIICIPVLPRNTGTRAPVVLVVAHALAGIGGPCCRSRHCLGPSQDQGPCCCARHNPFLSDLCVLWLLIAVN